MRCNSHLAGTSSSWCSEERVEYDLLSAGLKTEERSSSNPV